MITVVGQYYADQSGRQATQVSGRAVGNVFQSVDVSVARGTPPFLQYITKTIKSKRLDYYLGKSISFGKRLGKIELSKANTKIKRRRKNL